MRTGLEAACGHHRLTSCSNRAVLCFPSFRCEDADLTVVADLLSFLPRTVSVFLAVHSLSVHSPDIRVGLGLSQKGPNGRGERASLGLSCRSWAGAGLDFGS